MTQRFEFADAWWFRLPLRFVVLAVSVFVLMSLEPAITDSSSPDHGRALAGLAVLACFLVGSAVFIVSLGDSYIEVDEGLVSIQFESFFRAAFPVSDIHSVAPIEPRPRWRHKLGLATNFRDRISCSHGGPFVEVQLRRPCMVKLWPRTMYVTRFWLATPDHRQLIAALGPGDRTDSALPPAAA